jgi:hypothetical protein
MGCQQMKNEAMVGGETLTVAQTRARLGDDQISLAALYKAIKNGDVPCIRLGNKKILIPKIWLEQKLRGK